MNEDRSRRRDRTIERIVGFLSSAIYRDVDVHWVEPPRTTGPQLTVANHFGGLADGIVLLSALPRRPRIIARDLIWKVPVVGRLMTWIGAIPVHKPEDRTGHTSNEDMFGACFQALAAGDHLVIFPEGVTRDDPSIARVRTGAARIVLGARDAGVPGIVVTPVGIHYEDKAALRSRVVVDVGRSIELDAVGCGSSPTAADDTGEVDWSEVTQLTSEIDRRLRRAAPDFESWREQRALSRAAEIALRPTLSDPTDDVPYELQTRLANALSDRPLAGRRAIRDSTERYDEHLDAVRVTDVDVADLAPGSSIRRRLVVHALVGLVMLPFAIAGAVVHVLPYLIVKAVGRLPVAPAVLATVKPAVAVGSFGVMWAAIAWWAGSEWGLIGASAALLLLPIYLAAGILLVERIQDIRRMIRRGRRPRRGAARTLRDERSAVLEAVWTA